MNMTITKKEIKAALQKNFVNVEFVKKDGTIRKMNCSLNMDLIPEAYRPKGTMSSSTKKQIKESSIIRAYEKNVGWRSFDVNAVKKFG